MLIADKLRRESRAEYLLYLWQMEDLARAYGLDAGRVDREYLSRLGLSPEDRQAEAAFMADLCAMMLAEGCRERGHVAIVRGVLQSLSELHQRLLASGRFPYYRAQYYKVLPYIVELRAKGGAADAADAGGGATGELETCFSLLYGLMTLRLAHKPVSPGSEAASREVVTLLGTLSDYYKKEEAGELEIGDN